MSYSPNFTGSTSTSTQASLKGSTSGMFTQHASAVTSSYSVFWPAAQASTPGYVLANDGTGNLSWVNPSSGSVTSVSVTTVNGFAGSVANATSTPAISISTTVTGVLKGSLSAITAAIAGTDYQAPISSFSAPANQFLTGFTAPNTFTTAQPMLSGLSDVVISSPVVNDVLTYNGTEWIDAPISNTSAGQGIVLFLDNTATVDGYGTLSITPNTIPTVTETVTVPDGTTVFGQGYLFQTALSTTTIPAGVWEFDFYCDTSSLSGTSNLGFDMFNVITEPGTITITGSGTSRTATASTGSPFVSGDANANQRLSGYIQTPGGTFQITGFTSSTVVTIATPGGYVNETAVSYTKHSYMFGATSPNINSTAPLLINTFSVQPAFSVNATDDLSLRVYATSAGAGTVTIHWYQNGNTVYSHMHTPLSQFHNSLLGLQGGSFSERYHISAAQAVVVGNTSGTNSGDVTIGTANGLSLVGQALSLQLADATHTGALSNTDWTTFNNAIQKSGSVAFTGDQSMGNHKLTSLANGTNPGDAVNYSQLTSVVTGLVWQPSVLDPDLVDDSLSTPPVSPVFSITYIIANGGTGAWAGLDGHAVWWDGADWHDVSTNAVAVSGQGTAVQVGDRFAVAIATAAAPAHVSGGLTGKTNYLVQITNNTPGAIAYTFVAPVNNYAVNVSAPGSQHYGSSFTYVSSSGFWVDFSGPAKVVAGSALAYDGNTLNVQFDNSTINLTGNALEVKAGGITNTHINASAAIARSKLASGTNFAWITNSSLGAMQDTSVTANRAVASDSNGLPVASATTDVELGYVSGVTSSIQTQLNGKQATGNYITALSGDVSATGPGSVSATIQANVVTNSKLAQMAANTVKGNNTGLTANAVDLTQAQLTAMINQFTSSLQGVVPGSGGGTTNFLRADGTWAVPPGTTSGSVTSVAMTVPAFLSVSGSPITTSGTLAVSLSGTALPVANGGTGLVSGTSGGILGFTATGTITSSSALTANQLIIGGGAGATPSTLAAGSQYQVLTMGATTPGYGAVNLAQSAAVTGILPNANTTATSTSSTNSIVSRDANANTNINNVGLGYTTTATAAGTTLLSASSTYQQYFTGTTTQAVNLPSATTLTTGFAFLIVNQSTGAVTVQNAGSGSLQVLASNTQAIFTCTNTGTSNGTWNVYYSGITLTGDVTGSGTNSISTTIATNAVTNTKLAQMASNTIKGNNAGITANAADLTTAQVLTMLGIRAGTISLGSAASTGSATFSTAFGSTNYAISASLVNTTDTNPQFQPITITAQSTTGFSFKLNDPTDTANYSVQYIAIGNN